MKLLTKLAAVLGTAAIALPLTATASAPASSTPTVTSVYAVKAPLGERTQKLLKLGYDVVEYRDGDTMFVTGDASTAAKLAKDGFEATLERTVDEQSSIMAADGETYYGGYHTPKGVFAEMDRHVKAHPDLIKSVDFGKTYSGKFPMRAYCITSKVADNCNQSTQRPAKGRFFLMTQTHAREIATSEVALMWVASLMDKAGKDADVANLLENTEIWVMPASNPDGHDYVANVNGPNMQRKNRNPENGNCTGVSVGVDLNRNMDSRWNTTGVSDDPCDDTFPGSAPASEVENKALVELLTKLFPDQRGPRDTDAAPQDATGYFLSIHSVAALNLFPWQGVDKKSPNDEGLRAIMETASRMNGYKAGRAPEVLYEASGGHDDWIYDKLGVASGTIELGADDRECGRGNFHPKYSCMKTYADQNLPVLNYLAKIAKAPYQLGTSGYVSKVAPKGIGQVDVTVLNPRNDLKIETSFRADFGSSKLTSIGFGQGKSTTAVSYGQDGQKSGLRTLYVRTKNTRTGAVGPATAVWVTVK